MFSHLQESRTKSHVTVAWADKHHHCKWLLSPCSSLFICWVACHMECDICPSASSLVRWGEEQKRPWLYDHCSTTAKTSLCYQHCVQCKSKIIAHASPVLLGKLTAKTSTDAQLFVFRLRYCCGRGTREHVKYLLQGWDGDWFWCLIRDVFLSSAYFHVCSQQINWNQANTYVRIDSERWLMNS